MRRRKAWRRLSERRLGKEEDLEEMKEEDGQEEKRGVIETKMKDMGEDEEGVQAGKGGERAGGGGVTC